GAPVLTPIKRRLVAGGLIGALTGAIYAANVLTPSTVRLGILYLLPILLATWYQGVWWGIAFLAASMLLRIPVELGQQPDGAVRQADIVGRMGGDEFAVLMPETASDVAEGAAGRLAKSLRAAFQGNPSVTASIGIVSCTDSAVTPDDVLHKADRAMYEAKSKGKDQAVKVAM